MGCLRNEHLLALNLNPKQQMRPITVNAVDNLFNYAMAIVKVQLPDYFYCAWMLCILVPINKVVLTT